MTLSKRSASERGFRGTSSSRIRHARKLARLTQASLANRIGVGPSAVAQWELPIGTSPTLAHLVEIAIVSGVTLEWLATGRGPILLSGHEAPAIDGNSFTLDQMEDRALAAFRHIPARKRELFVRWMEDFF